MIQLEQLTYGEIDKEIAKRFVKLRKRNKITQKELASKSGVSYASLRRFEETGDISLASLTKLAIILKTDDELNGLFKKEPYEELEELFNE